MMIQKAFRFRAFISLLTGFSFILMTVSGIILYITPPGRVANWTQWRFWGFSKHEWSAVHICLSTLFLIVSLLHIWLNFKPLMNYFVRKSQSVSKLRFEWIAAAVCCGIAVWGSLRPFMPFSSLLELNERIKFSWEKPQQQAPIPHAELLTINELAKKADLEADVIQLNLKNNGIEVGLDEVFGDIAKKHDLSPNKLFDIAVGNNPASGGNQKHGGQRSGSGGSNKGFGQKTLKSACSEMGIDPAKAMEALSAAGIEANSNMSIRTIADEHDIHPSQIRKILEDL